MKRFFLKQKKKKFKSKMYFCLSLCKSCANSSLNLLNQNVGPIDSMINLLKKYEKE